MSQENKNELVTINPTTGEEISRYPMQTWDEVDASIKNCHEAFKSWKMKPIEKRAEVITAIGKKLKEKSQ